MQMQTQRLYIADVHLFCSLQSGTFMIAGDMTVMAAMLRVNICKVISMHLDKAFSTYIALCYNLVSVVQMACNDQSDIQAAILFWANLAPKRRPVPPMGK